MAKRGRPTNTQREINRFKEQQFEPKAPIATEMFLPNVSNIHDFARKDRVSGGIVLGIRNETANYTIQEGDHTILCNGTFTVTLPAATGVTGLIYNIKNIGTGTITVDGNASETIDGGLTAVLNNQFESISIQCDGSNWHII